MNVKMRALTLCVCVGECVCKRETVIYWSLGAWDTLK